MESKPAQSRKALHQLRPLEVFFQPKNVAVIGATEAAASVGRAILWNLISNPFGGTVFPVNPHRSSVLGIKSYSSVAAIPEAVDLAVIATAASTVPGIVGECAEAGVNGAIVISAGFRECGEQGAELERQILAQARRCRMRIIGPNCLGVMSPLTGLNATFASAMARPGNVAFVSQSGALCTAILDWSLREFVGFSAFVSVGSMLDVGWGDLIDYLGDDASTRSIIIYMESIGDARSFLSAAREVALNKPIILIKAGCTQAAAKAAVSHTGALAGSFEVLDTAFRRCGVLRVDRISDLFYMAEVLAKQPRPKGPRLAIVTNAGGPGVLATDALISGGGQLADLSPATIESLNKILSPHWSHGNPIDILGDAPADRYAKSVELVAQDANTDGVLVILAPQALTDSTLTAEQLKRCAKIPGKPILASWMGGAGVAAGEDILNRANIPVFPYPDTAARAFSYMWRYSYNLRGLYETPAVAEDSDERPLDRDLASRIIQAARGSGRTVLTEFESKRLLAAYGISTVETCEARSEEEALEAAERIGYPVVLKLLSETITHKSDVGGVHLNLADKQAVCRAYCSIESSVREKAGSGNFLGVTVQPMLMLDGYELIVGSTLDSQFGPVLLFGSGGQLVEVFKDRALMLPPLNTTLARRAIEQTQIFSALEGVRGRPRVDIAGLERLLVRFSQLVVEQRWVKEIDINPLLASPEGLVALDARVVLHGPEVQEDQLTPLAIRPYPTQYVWLCTLKDGTQMTVRPIRPEDEPLMVNFHQTLSERSVYFRYFGALKLSLRVEHERLTRICFIDYDRQIALVADRKNPTSGLHEILAVGRLTKLRPANEAEFAILVTDEFQHQGLGAELTHRLVEIARQEKLDRIIGYVLAENLDMQRLCQKFGFRLQHSPGDPAVNVVLDLRNE
jgi:acetyltransferase